MSGSPFRPCSIIPCYNHGYALASIVQQLSRYQLPTIIVNDGSSDETHATLEALKGRYSFLSVIHREKNGGKGIALIDGLTQAIASGYSHALLLDSDGQHDSDAIPSFLQAAERSPNAMILGRPLFGAEAPLVRRVGRELSNIFVVAATCRLAARDVLCGFRVYPLALFERDIDLRRLQPRMGFDVEMVVRAIWAGCPVINIPTHVSYPEAGVSHFRYGADNIQLARLYVRLFAEGLYRVPRRWYVSLCGERSKRQHWFQFAERGSLRVLKLLLLVLEKIGRIPLFLLLGPIVLHLFVWGRSARQAAVDFQRQIMTLQGRKSSSVRLYLRALRQFWEFGVSIVEKVISWREGIPLEKFTWVGRDEVKRHLATGKGAVFMGAHVGNIEVLRALGETRQVMVNALMFTDNARHFRALLEEVNPKSHLRVVDLSEMDPSIIFDLQERVAQGEIVALLGDRAPRYSADRVVHVPFLGRVSRFPEGPWILASLLEAPVYSVFSMRERGGCYRVEFQYFADRISLPRVSRRAALDGYIMEFSKRLEEIVLRYPFQWFNFYEFWSKPSAIQHDPVRSSAEPAIREPIS